MRDEGRRAHRIVGGAAFVALLGLIGPLKARAQDADRSEPGSKEAIAAATTEPRFVYRI